MIFDSAPKTMFSAAFLACTMEKVSSDEKKSTIPPVTNKVDAPVSEKENQDIEQPVNVKNPDASGKEDLPDIQALDLGKVSISVKEV